MLPNSSPLIQSGCSHQSESNSTIDSQNRKIDLFSHSDRTVGSSHFHSASMWTPPPTPHVIFDFIYSSARDASAHMFKSILILSDFHCFITKNKHFICVQLLLPLRMCLLHSVRCAVLVPPVSLCFNSKTQYKNIRLFHYLVHFAQNNFAFALSNTNRRTANILITILIGIARNLKRTRQWPMCARREFGEKTDCESRFSWYLHWN